MFKQCISFVTLCFYSIILYASTEQEIPVSLHVSAPDKVGQRLAHFIKEEIRSGSIIELDDNKDSGLHVYFKSIDPRPDSPGWATSYAYVIGWQNPTYPAPFILGHNVGHCGTLRIQECAETVIVEISQQAETALQDMDPSDYDYYSDN